MRTKARECLPTAARVGGHWESGAAALLEAVWWDLRLASLLTHLLWPPYVIGQAIIFFALWFLSIYLSIFFLA